MTIGDHMTPVLKRNQESAKKCLADASAFDDSFVQFSMSKEMKEDLLPATKSLYGPTQLASMLGSSTASEQKSVIKNCDEKKEESEDLFPESCGHFDSFLRDLSEHDLSKKSRSKLSRKKSPELLDRKEAYNTPKKADIFQKSPAIIPKKDVQNISNVDTIKRSPELHFQNNTPKNVQAISNVCTLKRSPELQFQTTTPTNYECDFELTSSDFFEQLEEYFKPPEFKVPNLQDFEARTTPKAGPSHHVQSQSPVQATKSKKRAIISSSEEEDDHSSPDLVKKKSVKKKRRKINKFIDDEAEISGSDSEDEDISDDKLEESFVDDATQKEVSVDEKALYLRSIRSPVKKQSRLLKPILNREDIFSQAVTDSMLNDDYEEDSFVTETVEYESSTADELDFVEEFENVLEAKKKPQTTTLKKRKRIIMSESEDEEVVDKSHCKVIDTPPSNLKDSKSP